MTTMIEKVARAVCAADGNENPDMLTDPKDEPAWTHYVDFARAAISAMQDPTEQMVEASIFLTGTDVYDAMIAAALEETEQQPDTQGYEA